jgi:hypothetical protein
MKMVKHHNGLNRWAIRALGANACTTWTYSLTWASAHAQHNCVAGGGGWSSAISKDLWEVKACML